MRSKDQVLLEKIYNKVNQSKEEKKAQMKAYDELAEEFAAKLKEVFGDSLFTKKSIYANKDKFENIDKRYQELFKTEYSLFSFEETGERLGNLLSKIGIKKDELKLEEGPNGMIYWFQNGIE